MPPAVRPTPKRIWSSDLIDLPVSEPCRPHSDWILHTLSAGFSWQRLGAGLAVATLWTLPLLVLGTNPSGWGLFWAMLVSSLLGTIPLLALIRSVMLQLGCDRSLTPLQELPFAWHWRRSACAVGLSFTLLSLLIFAGLSTILPERTALIVAAVCWWIFTALGCAAIAGDGADAIDALQRAIIYVAHRPLTALLTLLVPGYLAYRWVPSAWYPLGWETAVVFIGGGVLATLISSGIAGAYLSLRYANDGQEPAELWDSGPQITMGGGWLKVQPAGTPQALSPATVSTHAPTTDSGEMS